MNPFETHGIQRLSPSSLNTFRQSPARWVVQYLFKVRDPFGSAAASRGKAVEEALWRHLHHGDNEAEALQAGMEIFNEETAFEQDTVKVEKERKNIVKMFGHAVPILVPYGKPTSQGKAITCDLPGVQVPVIGYTDFSYDEYGMDIDIKSIGQKTSAIKSAHMGQFAIYKRATNWTQRVLYTWPAAAALYELEWEQEQKAIKEMTATALTLQHVLSQSDDPTEIAKLYAPDFEQFFWGKNTTSEAQTRMIDAWF